MNQVNKKSLERKTIRKKQLQEGRTLSFMEGLKRFSVKYRTKRTRTEHKAGIEEKKKRVYYGPE